MMLKQGTCRQQNMQQMYKMRSGHPTQKLARTQSETQKVGNLKCVGKTGGTALLI